MKKRLSILICLLFLGTACLLAQEAKMFFKNMPDSLCPSLSAVNRADFIDFLESKMKAEVTNRFGGKSEMTALSPDYIKVRMSSQSFWEMKLLPMNDSTKVICVVSTACAPACDSRVKFYAADWQELPSSSFLSQWPAMNDFLTMNPDTSDVYRQAALRQADMLLVKAELAAEEPALTFTLATTDYMDKEAAEKLTAFIRRSIVYRWEKGHFILP
ncbi:uncharacterized protein DUF3256 [Bacteroides zoogleoformans]|uniref:DUF3256 domain-containing protein n=2 Tax=Bacteroides zoogleoformans TaxID=28119 RepID=A0ABN5INQ1_9BACE|nr:DUF3256 domain-containing protein [Bacteroides zoogleoformans]TWJ13612.1 uncharacterized protein DUF3256 [Bacteroides zoogleoformans]